MSGESLKSSKSAKMEVDGRGAHQKVGSASKTPWCSPLITPVEVMPVDVPTIARSQALMHAWPHDSDVWCTSGITRCGHIYIDHIAVSQKYDKNLNAPFVPCNIRCIQI